MAQYPATAGRPELRGAIGAWLERRFNLPSLEADRHVLPLNGTREGLFAVAQTLVTHGRPGAVLCPNPFYQIYEGAALLAGTEPVLLNCDASNGFPPRFRIGDRRAMASLPTVVYLHAGATPPAQSCPERHYRDSLHWRKSMIFVIASDECYSEIYPDEQLPPVGLLEARRRHGQYRLPALSVLSQSVKAI